MAGVTSNWHALEPALERIGGAATLDALLAEFRTTVGAFGFDHSSIVIVPLSPAVEQTPFLDSDFPQEFVDVYETTGAYRFDPYWQVMTRSILPILHRDMVPKFVAEPRLHPVHETGTDLKLTNGMIVPVASLDVARGVGLWSLESEAEFDALVAAHGRLLHLVVIHFMAAIEAFNAGPERQADLIHLSAREKDCLRLSALGFNSVEIGEQLGISERTVKFHIGNAGRKLASGNRIEAVSSALRLGLIEF